MKKWKSKKPEVHGIWTSEVNLREVDAPRIAKVNKLLSKLEKDGFDASIS